MSVDYSAISDTIRDTIAETPRKSKRVLLKTLLRHYGHKTRQKHWLDNMETSLVGAGVIVTPSLNEVQKDDWVVLSVTDPVLPVADFRRDPGGGIETGDGSNAEADPWLTSISSRVFASEKEVEIRFVIPLLDRLGFSEDDRSDGYPVEQVVGVKKSRTEADFVLFDGHNRTKDNALLVVEAKTAGKNLADHISQARSYAMFLGTPYYLVTNGDDIRVFLYRSPIESDVEVFKAKRHDLAQTFSTLYNYISREAIVEYKRKRAASSA